MTGGAFPPEPPASQSSEQSCYAKKSLPENEERLFLIVLIDSYLLPTVT